MTKLRGNRTVKLRLIAFIIFLLVLPVYCKLVFMLHKATCQCKKGEFLKGYYAYTHAHSTRVHNLESEILNFVSYDNFLSVKRCSYVYKCVGRSELHLIIYFTLLLLTIFR